ncbi:unnamed protein product [Cuscuta campestris]|uniref:Leucine-rich repeat-containing N-terminal plant-type domain-containing protein n=1 Tax=Cuscuta campestris TaxID=132261 RepID=A0A484KPZ0_9ASTE|nr:unnamed protein product [Cuscuta campestris]
MESPFYLLFLVSSSLIILCHSMGTLSPSSPSLSSLKKKGCHIDEMAALLQFKHSFVINTNQCDDDDHRNLLSWQEGATAARGRVLNVMNKLIMLDLSFNDFNSSPIPSAIGNLSSLTHLNLSGSSFTGRIPHEQLSKITTLVSLDLSLYFDYYYPSLGIVQQLTLSELHQSYMNISSLDDYTSLGLELHSLERLVQHMSNLKELRLSYVNISSSSGVLDLLSNFSALESLHLAGCGLEGEFPGAIFNLPKLKMLNLHGNYDLKGYLPNFRLGSPLKSLWLSHTSFGGVLPPSIGNLASLEELEISYCNFTGKLPVSLALRIIDLSNNSFGGKLPSKFIDTLNPMRALNVSHKLEYMEQTLQPNSYWVIEEFGPFDYSITMHNKGFEMNYMKIPDIFCGIDFSSNNFEGQIPDTFGDLAGLQLLNLSRNNLSGHIPSSFSNMKNLECLDLSQNQLSGQIPTKLTKLTYLSSFDVSFNDLSGPIPKGNEFCTFDSKSYEGNPRLSLETWNKQCGNARSLPQLQQPPSITEEDDTSEYDLKIKWVIISIGFLSGLVGGVIVGIELTTRKHYWFVKKFARMQSRWCA